MSLDEKFDPICALPDELGDFVESLGQPRFRGGQIFSWIHCRSTPDPESMTNLPKDFRSSLSDLSFGWPARVGETLTSQDGTRKLQIVLNDGLAVETVLIPEGDKLTQCISCQVGCAVKCVFCRSGHAGLKRNLTASEIIAQVHLAKAHHLPDERLRNIVFMGVGEPLHNLKAVVRALELLSHSDGLDLSTRRITISTAGVIQGIEKLAQVGSGNIALAISLHAADPQTRAQLVPGISATPLQLVEALQKYPLPKRRRFTIEYVLIKGVNDSDADARKLAKLLSSIKTKVNLLPLNPHDKTDLEPPSEARILAFQDILVNKGITALLRRRRGDDIKAACGQLLST